MTSPDPALAYEARVATNVARDRRARARVPARRPPRRRLAVARTVGARQARRRQPEAPRPHEGVSRMSTPFHDDPRLQRIFDADAALTAPGNDTRSSKTTCSASGCRCSSTVTPTCATSCRARETYGDNDLYVWSDGRRQTFTGLIREVAEVAAGLRDRYGIGKGDRVRDLRGELPGVDPHVLGVRGPRRGPRGDERLVDRRRDAQRDRLTTPHLLIIDEKRHARLEDAEVGTPIVVIEHDWPNVAVAGVTELPDVEIHEDDPFELLFTSGTTGRPKAAILSHRAVIAYIQLQPYGAARGAPPSPAWSARRRSRYASPCSRCSTCRGCPPSSAASSSAPRASGCSVGSIPRP